MSGYHFPGIYNVPVPMFYILCSLFHLIFITFKTGFPFFFFYSYNTSFKAYTQSINSNSYNLYETHKNTGISINRNYSSVFHKLNRL